MKNNKKYYLTSILFLISSHFVYPQTNKIKLDRNPTDTIKSFDTFNQNLLDSLICIEVNVFRRQYGLKPLKFTKFTKEYCKKHSKDMYNKKLVFHNTKELDSIRHNENVYIGECCLNSGFNFNYTSYLKLSKEIVDMWKKSPPHKLILLSSDYTHLCVGNFLILSGEIHVKIFSTLQVLYEDQ